MAFPGLTRLFRLAVRPPAVEQDIDAEIGFHLDEEIRILTARGVSPEAARQEARRRFGDLKSTRAGLASLIPAWRAGRADPITALRSD